MFARHCVATLLLPALLYTSAASAVDDLSKAPGEGAASAAQAPVGHRQPRAADVANVQQNTPAEKQRAKRDRELDRRLQICRGC